MIELKKRKHHCPEEIVRKLQKADRLAGNGSTADEIARELGVSAATYYQWKSRYGAMNLAEAKELRHLRDENLKLKRLVAEKELDLLALTEIAKGNW